MTLPAERRTNALYAELAVGEEARLVRRLSRPDLEAAALVSGEIDPVHLRTEGAPGAASGDAGVDAVAAQAIVCALLHRELPGPGSEVVSQSLAYSGRLRVGDEIEASVRVAEKLGDGELVAFDARVMRGADCVVQGRIVVRAPRGRVSVDAQAASGAPLQHADLCARWLERCAALPPVRCAVVHPCDRESLLGAIEAARRGLIDPVLVGPEPKIRAAAAAAGVDLAPYAIVGVEHSHAAAASAVALARAGQVGALMKGSLHPDELMQAVVPADAGLRTGRRISHAFVLDVPASPRPLIVTDAAINVEPDVLEKADIVRNAIDLAHVLGVAQPRVAILAAVETVNPQMRSTVDAAMLCKMADRGQITGALVDGPLAFDNAVSEQAARMKRIDSAVAGRADILLMPDLEAGNMVAKQLQYLAGAESAGIVLGARVPIVLTSRADSVRARLASAAVMKLVAHAARGAAGGGAA